MIIDGIRYARKCSECGKGMNKGYVIGSCEYYCSDECLHKHVSPEEFLGLYDDGEGDSFYTDWGDQNDWDDDDEAEEALRIAIIRDYAITRDYQRVRDAAPDLLAALETALEMLIDSWGDEQIAAGDDQVANVIKAAINKAKGN
jgi:hypothetical protein